MNLAEKIALIDQERRRVEDQFNTELNAGLTQYHAMKTKEETDARLEAEKIRTTPTDITTTITDTGKQRITKGRTGEIIKTETEIGIPKVGYKEVKFGNEIITYQDGKEIARSPRWKPETIKGKVKTFNALQKARINKWAAGIADAEERIQLTQQDILYYNDLLSQAMGTKKGIVEVEQDGEMVELTSKQVRTKLIDTIRALDIDTEAIEGYEKKLKKMGLAEEIEEEKEQNTGGYEVDEVVGDYKYLGGDYTDKSNWEKVE